MKLSIVTTLYRSAPTLPEFIRRTSASAQKKTSDYEIILVNDGSPDDSFEIAAGLQKQDPHLVVVDLTRNFGHHRALMTGLMYARGESVFVLDSDLEEEPEWMLSFDDVLRREGCDVVYGVQDGRKGGFFERASGALFYSIFNLLSTTPIPSNAAIARLMTRRYVQDLVMHQERELFLPGVWQLTGYKQVPVTVRKHAKVTTTYNLARKVSLFVNALTSFSDRPLVYIFYTGAVISLTAGLFIARMLYRKWIFGSPIQGWPSLIVSIWFLGGLTIFFIGVLGIYMAKLYVEVKHRPYTLVRQVLPGDRHDRDAGSQ